jgi:hypothetical protein
MKPVNSVIAAALFALGAGAMLPAAAADNPAAIVVKGDGSVPYVSGGVGDDERQQMEKMAADYPLQLLFATKGSPNEFLAGVTVQIKDKDGKLVLDTVSKGPYLLAKMPAGKYSVSADNDGVVKRQDVQIAGTRTQRLVFVW